MTEIELERDEGDVTEFWKDWYKMNRHLMAEAGPWIVKVAPAVSEEAFEFIKWLTERWPGEYTVIRED